MGTSKSFGGAKGETPLIPSWLSPENTEHPVPVILGDKSRFKQARANLARYVSSDGKNDSYLKKGISSYIKTSYNGAKHVANRMGVSKTSAKELVSFLIDAATQGLQATLHKYNLSKLQDFSLEQAYTSLVDVFCKSDGKIDTAISRDAYLLTIEELENADMLDKLEKPDEETIFFMLKKFITLSIKNRLFEDIGQSIFLDNKAISVIQSIENQIKDFIELAVDDAIIKFKRDLTISDITNEMDKLYENSYDIMKLLTDKGDKD